MLGFLFGFLTFSRVRSRTMRIALTLLTIALLVAGLVYAIAVFRAIAERSSASHVHSQHPR